MSDCICHLINARNCPVHQANDIQYQLDTLKASSAILKDALWKVANWPKADNLGAIAREALREVDGKV